MTSYPETRGQGTGKPCTWCPLTCDSKPSTRYLKDPELSIINVIAMRGAKPSTATSSIMYVQNAAKNGAAAWMLAEVGVGLGSWL